MIRQIKKSLFLDRDGVINRMVRYMDYWDSPQKADDVKLVNIVEKLISWANINKIMVIEVSNQPGVAIGKMSQKTSDAIEKNVHKLLKEKGCAIDKIYICPHHPKGVVPDLAIECDCRKPKPGLLIKAAKEHNINLKTSIFLGDKDSDILAGRAAGCYTILFLHKEDEPIKVKMARKSDADFKSDSLEEILTKIQDIWRK